MASTLQIITELSALAAVKLTNRPTDWTEFLRTAAWNYKYSFAEQILIYAQKPTATACATIELWNERFGRRVKRGSRGIALIDDTSAKLRLRYVFDISDTVSLGNRQVPIWRLDSRYQDAVTEALEASFGELGSKDSVPEAIISAAGNAAEDNMADYLTELLTVRDGSFLEELDDFNVEVSFKRAIRTSVAYIALTRCGIDAGKFFDADDFVPVLDFNTLPTVSMLGVAVSDISEMLLREIGDTIRHQRLLENHKFAKSENLAHNVDVKQQNNAERGDELGDDVHDAGRLPAARPDAAGAADHREIWDAAQIIPQKSQEGDVHEPAAVREADGAPVGNRPDGQGARGADDGAAGHDGGRERGDEGRRPDEVDGADEQHEALGGGDGTGGTDLQLEWHDRRTEDNSLPFLHSDDVIKDILRTVTQPGSVSQDIADFYTAHADNSKRTEYIKRFFGNGPAQVTLDGGRQHGYKTYQNVLHLWEGDYAAPTAQAYYDWGLIARYFATMSMMGELLDRPPLPTEQEQITLIEQAESEKASAFLLPQEAIDELLRWGSGVQDGKLRIYIQFQNNALTKENAAFLSHEYGVGGSYPIMTGTDIDEMHDSKGIRLKSKKYIGPEKDLLLTWPKVSKRIGELIAADSYLTGEEKARLPAFEAEQAERARIVAQQQMARVPEPARESADYVLSLGAEVHIGADAYEILSFDAECVVLFDPVFPLFNKEMSREEFDRKVRENPLNDHLIEKKPTAVPQRSEDDVFDEYSALFVSKVLSDKAYMNARSNSDEQNARTECDAAVECVFHTFDPLEHIELYRTYTESPSFDQRLKDYVFQKTYIELADMIEPGETRAPAPPPLAELTADDFSAYLTIKNNEPNHLVAFRAGDYFELYGEDAAAAQSILNSNILNREIPGVGTVDMTGFRADEWVSTSHRLWRSGRSIVLYEPDGDGGYRIVKRLAATDYIPLGMEVSIDDRRFVVDAVDFAKDKVSLRDVTFTKATGFPIFRAESIDLVHSYVDEQRPEPISEELLRDVIATQDGDTVTNVSPDTSDDTECVEPDVAFPYESEEPQPEPQVLKPSWEKHSDNIIRVRFDLVLEAPTSERLNFHITDDNLGHGGQKTKYGFNAEAIRLLKSLEAEKSLATAEEQEVLSRYVGWGGIPQAFDENNSSWTKEYAELKELLSEEEYRSARESTLNAHYTSPMVIKAIYTVLENMGFRTGNVLEPGCGIGNFFGLVPESMSGSKFYGVELDSITGRIARQLYQKNSIAIQGYETADFPDSFFDLAIGNVPFGAFGIADRKYDRLKLHIHDYFFAKSLDKVRPGGIIAFITSKGTLDKQSPEVRQYIAQRAELLGAIRLPNNAFFANAGTEVTADILFFQKRDRVIDIEPYWVHLSQTSDGIPINQYFADHPDMVLGTMGFDNKMYGSAKDTTCNAIEGADLSEQLLSAIANIQGEIADYEVDDLAGKEEESIPADPSMRNFSYALVDDKLYYRENSRMNPVETSATAESRIRGMIAIRDCVRTLIEYQTDDYSDEDIRQEQARLNKLYDTFTIKYGLLSSRGNNMAFSDDSSYCLLCSLEVLDEDGNLERKADMFTKRTIRCRNVVTHVDTASEALAVSMAERARVDMDFMSNLTGLTVDEFAEQLAGVIFQLPEPAGYEGIPRYITADEYLSGNVREKLTAAREAVKVNEVFILNVSALEAVQPVDLTAGEISVRLGATWLPSEIVEQFMYEMLGTARYDRGNIRVHYSPYTSEWNISGKNVDRSSVKAFTTYGTDRINAYKIIEETLSLRDVRIFDVHYNDNGSKRYVLNRKETAIAQAKQELIKSEFSDWIWKDQARRDRLCRLYNDKFNSIRPREYDGRHIQFVGMNPEITLRSHQVNAIAHILYGGNTLLAHVVGAGKTYEMVAAAMESRRLGLCQKSLFVVPNHLTDQWGAEFLQLYPSANIMVATKKDFETKNRKKFCGRIATGDYDAVIIGHSQFEKIPMSILRQKLILQEQLSEVEDAIRDLKNNKGENFSIKQLERTKKGVKLKLDKLNDQSRKDDVVTFEELGVDRLFVDESHNYKNLFLFSKMRNVGGIAQTEAQKSSDLFMKCRYLDELTGNRGTVFATGTPISNSMVEMYTIQRYLQYKTLQRNGLQHFDSWASTFGETVTAIELAPEGTGYRAKTRFARFYNLPELMAMFKEVADIQTADMLNLPVPKAIYHVAALKPSELQAQMVAELAKRAERVRNGIVDPSEDNLLLITNDGRKLALDQRLINPMLPDDENSKAAACAENVFKLWEENKEGRLTQLVFCDLSTPHYDGKFNIYDDIKQKLIDKDVPPEEIAFIHDADTEAKKEELFSKVRSGRVRILLGSTFKMGAGTNVQDRLIASHDIDCPWRPSDLEQRGGRIIRQGNRNPEAHIFRYVTENTFDAYLYQLVESKQRFVAQIMTSKSPVRSCEDVDETALSYAEIKALATGNPHIKEKIDLEISVSKLRLLKSSHLSQKYALEDAVVKELPAQIRQYEEIRYGYKADIDMLESATLKSSDGEAAFTPMTVLDQRHLLKEDAGKALIEVCKQMTSPEPRVIGSYRGFELILSFDSGNRKFNLAMKNTLSQTITLGEDIHGNITRIDNALESMPAKLLSCEKLLQNAREQLETAKVEALRPFPQEEELKIKSARLAELDILLNIDKKTPEVIDDTPDEEVEASLGKVRVPAR